MRRGEGACLVCGAELTYYQEAKEMTCVFCGKKEMSHASCKEGHYVCDSCHADKGIEAIMRECGVTASKNPIEIMQKIMEDPYIYMHGPEHHVMAGAALLAAYHNCGGKLDLPAALQEMKERGSQVPGGVCGFWGCWRRRHQHRHIHEYHHQSHAAERKILGAVQLHDRQGAAGHRRDRRAKMLQTGYVHCGQRSSTDDKRKNGHRNGTAGTHRMWILCGKPAVSEKQMPISSKGDGGFLKIPRPLWMIWVIIPRNVDNLCG